MLSKFESECMDRALELAAKGRFSTSPNPNVGCVIAKDENIISEGWHLEAGGPHAEVMAILNAKEDLTGSSVFVTLEPCAHFGKTKPCVDLLIEKKVSRVFCGSLDPNQIVKEKGIEKLRSHGIEVITDLSVDTVMEQNKGYFYRHLKNRPRVTLKIASTIDGKIALANGDSQWITNELSRADAHLNRALSDVLITGVGTVLQDDPRFTTRVSDPSIQFKKPHVYILDSSLKTPIEAKILLQEDVFIVCTQEASIDRLKLFNSHRYKVIQQPVSGLVSLELLTEYLCSQEYNQVQVEAGAKINGSFMSEDLVDELLVYIAPKVMGASAQSMFDISELEHMNNLKEFKLFDIKQLGGDIRLRLRKKNDRV
jgi:diaminohydroxyphosphoribosylaminopyrimidine deaminase/5-amino-6-(5-phosphoribosylamino)uracil reductase